MPKPKPLHEMVEGVCDRTTFIAFVHALSDDRRDEVQKEQHSPSNPLGPGANGWENTTIETFLEAAAAWAEDTIKLTDVRQTWFSETATWQAFARFLYMGKLYE
jgi:hypothetical protein